MSCQRQFWSTTPTAVHAPVSSGHSSSSTPEIGSGSRPSQRRRAQACSVLCHQARDFGRFISSQLPQRSPVPTPSQKSYVCCQSAPSVLLSSRAHLEARLSCGSCTRPSPGCMTQGFARRLGLRRPTAFYHRSSLLRQGFGSRRRSLYAEREGTDLLLTTLRRSTRRSLCSGQSSSLAILPETFARTASTASSNRKTLLSRL